MYIDFYFLENTVLPIDLRPVQGGPMISDMYKILDLVISYLHNCSHWYP